MSKFTATENNYNNGFQIQFKNGWAISVQFGRGTYSDKNNSTAEIAIWDGEGNWYDFPDNEQPIKGWVDADEVADWIYRVSKW